MSPDIEDAGFRPDDDPGATDADTPPYETRPLPASATKAVEKVEAKVARVIDGEAEALLEIVTSGWRAIAQAVPEALSWVRVPWLCGDEEFGRVCARNLPRVSWAKALSIGGLLTVLHVLLSLVKGWSDEEEQPTAPKVN